MELKKYTEEELEIIKKYGQKMDEAFDSTIVAYSCGKRISRLDLALARMNWEKRMESGNYKYSYNMNCKWKMN